MSRLFASFRKPDENRAGTAVLAVALPDSECRQLISIAGRCGWDLLVAENCDSALALLREREVTVILCDRDLPGQDWRDAVGVLLTSMTGCCVVLMSRVNDEYLWQEVVQRGGYDVLAKPLVEEQVVSAVRRAAVYRNARLARVRK